uniref:Uncharacterized protein n=1 Tax=Lynx canadensis TaxID=61383 RepID=A0A667GW44_LYNCA
SATRVLPLALALTVVARVSWARGPSGALWPGQGRAALGRCCPGRDPTCVARGPPRCFCDQACGAVRDCRADCARVRPGVSCVVAEWSGWGRCLKPCQISHRVRQRHVLREPRNGGAPCPPLEERAGCVDDQRPQGAECQQSLIPALIATDSYGKERKKQGVPKEQETLGYCVRFQLGPIPGSCRQVRALHARWTRYLTRGHTVCVRCEWPAQDARSRRCYGDGGGAGGNQLLQWQAAGHPRCRGTWERLGQLRDCSCPEVHGLVFI